MHVWGPRRGLYKQGVEAIGINQTNTRVSSKAYKKQLGVFKRIRLDSSIVLDSCIGKNQWVLEGQSGYERATVTYILLELC